MENDSTRNRWAWLFVIAFILFMVWGAWYLAQGSTPSVTDYIPPTVDTSTTTPSVDEATSTETAGSVKG